MNPNINRHLPPYMPRKEALLLIWIEQFLNALKPMLGLFKIEQQDYDNYVENYGFIKNAYQCHVNSSNVAKADTRFKDLAFYDRNHLMASVPRQEETIFPIATSLTGGYVWSLVELIESQILPNPACSEDIKRQLQILVIEHAQPRAEELKADPDISCDGSKISIHLPILKPAKGQVAYADKHDGKGLVKVRETENATCDYYPEDLPAVETIWTFKIAYTLDGREIGTAAYLNVLVKRT